MRTDDSKSLKAGFVEIMEAKIFSGELKPGDRLPPERELALQLGISRGSVNQGILDMARMGFLRIVPRRGTFVADYVRNATPETLAAIMSYDSALVDSALFKDLMELRILVERECTRLACANLTPESLGDAAEALGGGACGQRRGRSGGGVSLPQVHHRDIRERGLCYRVPEL